VTVTTQRVTRNVTCDTFARSAPQHPQPARLGYRVHIDGVNNADILPQTTPPPTTTLASPLHHKRYPICCANQSTLALSSKTLHW